MTSPSPARLRFRGHIAGVGTSSGVRIVVGRWRESPLGTFGDAMVERSDGHRVLLAPSASVAEFVAETYEFDEVRIERFEITDDAGGSGSGWQVRSESLHLDFTIGRTTVLGLLLRVVPDRIATAPWWCALTDVVARIVLRGVRTRGETEDRREWYGATGNRKITEASGTFDGLDLGRLAKLEPPPRFGFSSTPPRPSVTAVVTTVELGPTTPTAPG